MRYILLHIKDAYHQKGLTLIELVVSIAISSIILLATFSFYSFSVKSYRDELDKLYVNQNARQALYVLSDSIKNAKTARTISRKKLEIVNRKGEKIYFSLENGTLYRIKNFGKNPVASLNKLYFNQPKNRKYIEIKVVVKKGKQSFKLETKSTPLGQN